MKRIYLGILATIMLLLVAIPTQAQLHVGVGAKVRNELPYINLLLAVNNNLAELAWTTQSLRVNEPNFSIETSSEIFAPLIKIFLQLDGPISPFLGLGGISISTLVAGRFKGKPVNLLVKREGAQGALGFSYHAEDYPIVLSGAIDYSTIEAEMPLSILIDDQIETLPLPFPGISGWGWSVNARYIFNFEQATDDLFEWLRSGFGLFNTEETEEDE